MVKLRGEVLKANKNKKCNVIEIKKVRRVRVYAFDFVQFLTLWKFSSCLLLSSKKLRVFLTKFWHFDQRFNKRIFTPVCMWKFETYAHVIYTTYKFNNMRPVRNLQMQSINVVTWFFLQILSSAQPLTWNVNLHKSCNVEV